MDVKPNYGYDKPDFAVGFSTLGAVIICLLILFYFFFRNSASLVFLVFGLILGFSFLVFGMTFVYSKYEKLRGRDILQSSIPWRGDEDVLHIGWGPGLLLVGTAKISVPERP